MLHIYTVGDAVSVISAVLVSVVNVYIASTCGIGNYSHNSAGYVSVIADAVEIQAVHSVKPAQTVETRKVVVVPTGFGSCCDCTVVLAVLKELVPCPLESFRQVFDQPRTAGRFVVSTCLFLSKKVRNMEVMSHVENLVSQCAECPQLIGIV